MNKYITAFLLTVFALEGFAAYTGPTYFTPGWGVSGHRRSYNLGLNNGWSHQTDNIYGGSWVFEQGDNNETYGGSQGFFRGANSGDTHLWIHGSGSGAISAIVNNSAALSGDNTTVIATDADVTQTSSLRTILLMDNHGNNNPVGNWTFEGGTYSSSAFEALNVRNVNSLTLDSASFISTGNGFEGAYIASYSPSVTIKNTRGLTDIRYQAGFVTSGNGAAGLFSGANATISGGYASFIASEGLATRRVESVVDNDDFQVAGARGGSGAVVGGTATINGGSYTFIGGEAGNATAGGDNAFAAAYGGHGAGFGSAGGTISNSSFRGTAGGSAEVVLVEYLTAAETYTNTAANADAVAFGGSGLLKGGGDLTLIDTDARGASGGSAIAQETGSYADASGGNGVTSGGNLTITGGRYQGSASGNASSREGEAYAHGGNGVYFTGTALTINDGTFIGANGGNANTENIGAADGGAGVRANAGTLTINGGTFAGGGAGRVSGVLQTGNVGVWAQNATLNINDTGAGTQINGDIYFNNPTAKSLTITGGTIEGDILKTGAGKATVAVNNAANYSGAFIQKMGDVDVNLSNSDESKFFSNVTIEDGTMAFLNQDVITADNSRFTLSSSGSALSTAAGMDLNLSTGSSIAAGFGQVSVGGDLIVGEGSSIGTSIARDGSAGSLSVTGDLVVSNANASALVYASGISATNAGSFDIVSNLGGTVILGSNALEDVVTGSAGWLTEVTSVAQAGSAIEATYDYNSMTNTSLKDLGPVILAEVDSVILGLGSNDFHSLNSHGESEGTSLIRYSVSQIPDASEAAFQMSQQVNGQIAARGTEFRSMNGFASTKPNFGLQHKPMGVAGPETEDENSLQGWVRAYGSFGDKDKTDNYAAYDSTSWGSVIGIDKSFGNLLIGVAGGFGRTDLDAGSTYDADIETYHGSIYSTIGGENIFVDLAATYGMSNTEAENDSTSDDFDSDIMSFYAGAGMSFDVKEKLSITPEASFLISYYEQEEYVRTGMLGGTVDEYDTTSYLSSLGVNVSTLHQLDWFNRGLALIPEVRAHWLHDFDADPEDFTYIFQGTAYNSAVRPRDEDIFRLGVGFDVWSWKYQSTKFEVDYDGMFSDTYREHVFSGKITVKF